MITLLFPRIRKVLDHRDKVYEQLSVYLQLRNVIERLQVKAFKLGISLYMCTKKEDGKRNPKTKPFSCLKNWPLTPTSFLLALQETKHSELYMQVDLGCNFFVDTMVWVYSLPSEFLPSFMQQVFLNMFYIPDSGHFYIALGCKLHAVGVKWMNMKYRPLQSLNFRELEGIGNTFNYTMC